MAKLCRMCVALLAFLVPGPGYTADPIVVRFSYVTAPDTPKGKAAQRFKTYAELDAGGRVSVQLYPNSTLYKDNDEMDALQRGAVEIIAPPLSKFASIGIRGFEIFDLPYIFPNKKTLYRALDGAIGKRLFTTLEPKGIIGLAYWDNGFKQLSANKEIANVTDVAGLRMRIQASKILEAQMRAMGAGPTVIGFSQQLKAMRAGEADGAENTVSNFYTQKLYEVQSHLTLTDHGYLGYAVIVNKKFWDALPADIRDILERAMREATEYERVIAQNENDEALLRIIGKTEIHILRPEARKEWVKTLLPVHKEFETVVGETNLQEIYAIATQADKEEPERVGKK